jgi:hypothetical protein
MFLSKDASRIDLPFQSTPVNPAAIAGVLGYGLANLSKTYAWFRAKWAWAVWKL